MKRFISFVFILILLISLSVPALAGEVEGESADGVSSVNDSVYSNEILTVADLDSSSDYELTGISLYSVSPIEASDTSGLKQVLLSLLGDYDAIVVEYEYKNSTSSNYSYLREIQPDYVWMASFLLFALIIYCLFRLGGALLGKC